ncbi:MAG: SIS domain-containing protein [Chlamydiae bacterium]|nr:SIS domain-containing protein [Chlamydiota bacterium]
MRKKIEHSVQEAIKASTFLQEEESLHFIEEAAELISHSFKQGGKLLVAGNGGSLCDAMHFAEELTGFYREKRPALAAIALGDPGHMSCVANDLGYKYVFSRGIEALGRPGDVFVAMTTSGNSLNLLEAVRVAKEQGLVTIAFLGKTGGALLGQCDLELVVRGFPYSDRVQEVHMAAIHIVIEMIEHKLFTCP